MFPPGRRLLFLPRDATSSRVIFSLKLTSDACRRLSLGEQWLSARDVVGRRPKLPGIATLLGRDREAVGKAFVSPGSPEFLRLITASDEETGREFWRRRLCLAFERRASLAEATDAFRVVHGDADGIPGVVIDRYGDLWAIQISCSGAMTIADELVSLIREEFAPASLVWCNDTEKGRKEGVPSLKGPAFGTRTDALVREGEEVFEVDLLRGHKTGAYLDYRALRFKARGVAHGRALDAFCYQGWLSCQIAAKVEEVVAVDASASAIEAARRNAKRGGHAKIAFVRGDVFELLPRLPGPFDFVHLDPPSFAKGRGKLEQALAGYRKLFRLSLPQVAPGGVLMASSCSHAVTERILESLLLDAVAKAGREAHPLFRAIQDIDHPLLSGHPESLYLKAIAARVG